jgi:hypothetical protein
VKLTPRHQHAGTRRCRFVLRGHGFEGSATRREPAQTSRSVGDNSREVSQTDPPMPLRVSLGAGRQRRAALAGV